MCTTARGSAHPRAGHGSELNAHTELWRALGVRGWTELAEDVRMRRYDWNRGGEFKGKPWSDEYVSDANVRNA